MKKIIVIFIIVICIGGLSSSSFARNHHHYRHHHYHHHHHRHHHNHCYNNCYHNGGCYNSCQCRMNQLMMTLPFAIAIGQSFNNLMFSESNYNRSQTNYQTHETRRYEDGKLISTSTVENINSEKIDNNYYHR